MCWDACDGCKSNVYSNSMGISLSVVPKQGGWDVYAEVPYEAPCHWCLSNPWGNCNSAGMCVILNYDPTKNCSNARLGDKFCEPRFEQGVWYPVFGLGCNYSGTTQSFTSRLERCSGSSCGTFTATSAPYEVEIPQALETNCAPSPDWECCEDESGSNCVGGPINISSGNMHYEEIDFTIEDLPSFSFKRSYNNQETSLTPTGGVMGYGWTHTFNENVVLTNTLPDGRRILRHINSEGIKKYYLETTPYSNEFDPYWPYDLKGKIEDDGTYFILKDFDGNTKRFTKSNGLWDRTCDLYGNCFYGNYTSGKLTQVIDPFGRTITFNYNSSNKIIEVILWDGKTFRYTYLSTNYLEKVFYPQNTSTTPDRLYVYDTQSPKNLIQVKNYFGNIIEGHTYNSQRKATSSYSEGYTNWIEITYPRYGQTIVKEHQNDTKIIETTYNWKYNGGRGLVYEVIGGCSSCGNQNKKFEYDEKNRVKKIMDGNGNITLKSYDSLGRLISVIEAYGTEEQRETYYYYENPGILGFVTKVEKKSVVKPEENKKIEYNLSEDYSTMTIKRTGYINETDPAPTEIVETITYDIRGRKIQYDGPRADVQDFTNYQYFPDDDLNLNNRGRLFRIINPLSQIHQFENYDVYGTPRLEIDPNAVQIQRETDGLGRIIEETILPSGSELEPITTEYIYTQNGELDYIIHPEGNITNYSYDPAGRLIEIEEEPSLGLGGEKIVYTLDKSGNKIIEEYQRYEGGGYITYKREEFEYDDYNRIKKKINFDGSFTEYFYDLGGNLVGEDDSNHPFPGSGDHYIENTYDSLNRLKTKKTKNGAEEIITQYFYDKDDNLIKVISPEGQGTNYKFDDFGNLINIESPDSGQVIKVYDSAGNLIEETDSAGITTQRTYDQLNRISTIQYPNPSYNVYFYYDEILSSYGIGRLTSLSDPSGTKRINYSRRGLIKDLTETISGINYVTSYTYNKNGNINSMVYPSGRAVWYNTNVTNGKPFQVNAIVNGESKNIVSNGDYLPFGDLKSLNFSNGLNLARNYDLKYRITSNSNGPISASYTYDNEYNILTITGSYSRNYFYDDLYRLTQATGIWGTKSYTYDKNGNRQRKTENSYTTNYYYQGGTNKLIQTTGYEEEIFTYNSKGSIISDSSHTYQYGDNGHLVSVDGGSKGIYVYDYEMKRRKAIYPDRTILFFYDLEGKLLSEEDLSKGYWKDYIYIGNEPISRIDEGSPWERIGDGYLKADKTGGKVHLDWSLYSSSENFRVLRSTNDFTFSNPQVIQELSEKIFDDDVLNDGNNYAYRIYKNVPAERIYFYHCDHLMTPLYLTDENQNILWQAEYYPFGRIFSSSGEIENNLRFPGQYADISNFLYYNYSRYYNPFLGRFKEEDHIIKKFGIILDLYGYSYANNNPIIFTDPLGLQKCRSGKCKDCESGEWVFAGFGLSGMLVFWGKETIIGRYLCTDNPMIYCNLVIECSKFGIGIGGSFFAAIGNLGYSKTKLNKGYKIYCVEDIGQSSEGVFGEFGIGKWGGIGGDISVSSGSISGGSGSIGIGLGGGMGAMKCKIKDKSCKIK